VVRRRRVRSVESGSSIDRWPGFIGVVVLRHPTPVAAPQPNATQPNPPPPPPPTPNQPQPTGINVGIATDATIRCIKVLDDGGSGSLSNVIAGLNTVAGYQKANPSKRVVCSLSLGAPFNQLVNDAVVRLLETGAIPVVAAGNSNIVRFVVDVGGFLLGGGRLGRVKMKRRKRACARVSVSVHLCVCIHWVNGCSIVATNSAPPANQNEKKHNLNRMLGTPARPR
jgi:hypothetical protein